MKLCIILVCLFSFSLSATTLAQRERVSMKLQEVSLRQVLEQIREQTKLQFMMSKEQGERVGRVSVDAVNETVAEVLDKVFASTGVLCLLQTVPVYYPYATSDKSILWEYGTKVLKFPQKSEGLLIK